MSTFRIGESVALRGDTWTIGGLTRFADCEALRLHRAGGAVHGGCRTFLLPFDRPRRRTPNSSPQIVSPRRWLHRVRRLGCDAHPFGGLRAAAQSAIELLPYQLAPALACFRHGAPRILIADDVGLGKTIQAGLILNELAAASDACRAMVIVPAGLRDQWAQELANQFGLTTTIADAAWLERVGRELPPGVNPWALPGIFIASYDFLKRPEVLRPLEDLLWDAAVVDEAHNAARSTARRAAVDAIAARSARVVLLSATPHSGEPGEFDSLCAIGAGESDRLLLFRRSRAEAGAAKPRRGAMLPVRLTAAERRMHRLLDLYVSRVCRESRARRDAAGRLAACVLKKRALSCAASLAASAERRLQLLAAAPDPDAVQLALPLDDLPDDDDVSESVLSAPGLASPLRERRMLARIVEAARLASAHESKQRVLVRLLSRIAEPVIVFTEYRDTLARLQQVIAAHGHAVTLLHGGMTPSERRASQIAFDGEARILLATDAASEGLNLHARCRTVVHYELPWSPTRLEQRTGRVDRLGQRRTVHEILLVADDTAERLVLGPLLRRAARAGRALDARGPASASSSFLERLTESRVVAAMLGETPAPEVLGEKPAPGLDVPGAGLAEEAAHEADRLEQIRAWHTAAPALRSERSRPIVTCVESRTASFLASTTAIFELTAATASGRVVHREILAARSPLPASRVHGSVAERGRRFLEDEEPLFRAAISARWIETGKRVGAVQAAALDAAVHRQRAVAAAASSAPAELVQAGLFDRRALRGGAARHTARAAVLEEAGRRSALLLDERDLRFSIALAAVLFTVGRGAA